MGTTTLALWFALWVAAPVDAVGASAPPSAETSSVAPAPVVAHGPAPVVAQGPAPAPVYVQPPIAGPPKGTWMRVGGGLALGVGAALGISALICYATTDALAKDDLEGRETLRLISFGLGLGALAHLGAGIPLVVVGKQRQRRYEAWSRQRVVWRPRLAASTRGASVGLTLRF